MTGIVGGQSTGPRLRRLLDGLYTKPWYETSLVEGRTDGIALAEHGDRDSGENEVYQDDRYLAVVHGVISNEDELPWSSEELLPKLFSRPRDVLAKLEGPFLLACCDTKTGTFHVATDKVGSRPCYYTTQNGFHFGSELSGLLPLIDAPTVNPEAVSDLLLMGTVIGEKTLLEEVQNLPPASMVTYTDGEWSMERYWHPEAQQTSERSIAPFSGPDTYVTDWIEKHQRAVRQVTGTVDSDFGLWLSGGIDSRATAAALKAEKQPFTTLSYQTADGDDQSFAQQVASELGVENHQVGGGSPSEFRDSIQECIEINDGMQAWSFVASLPFMLSDLSEFGGVVMEGSTFLGEDLWAHSLQQGYHPADLLYRKKSMLSAEAVTDLVEDVDDPRRSLRQEVVSAGTANLPYRVQSLDAVRRLYSYLHMRSNIVQRSQVGTRVLTSGPLLSHVLNMPDSYRMNTVPLTDGKIPYGVPQIKLDVMREMSPELSNVPYHRTGIAPSKSRLRHFAGFLTREATERFVSPSPQPYLDWYRNEPVVTDFLNSMLDDACDRSFFNEDAVRTMQQRTLNGDQQNITPVAAITGLEYWLQQHIDSQSNTRVRTLVKE